MRGSDTAAEGTMIQAGVEDAVRRSFQSQGAMLALGVSMSAVDDGFCELELAFSEAVAQQHGYFHGGIIAAVGDSAGGYAANSKLMPERECLTAEYKINLLRPARGEALVARGRVIRAGRSLLVATVELCAREGASLAQCALMQMTLFAIDARAPQHPSA
jgi:uncharacterized protein (TIGR00369 family)